MQKAPEKPVKKQPGARILIVEDEKIVAMDIRNILQAQGYRVVGCAVSGEEAIAMAKEKNPELMLMDIRLRGAMTGIEAARIIRQNLQIPSVFLTSFSDRKFLQQAKESDALGYILKPFEERELEAAVEIALYRWQMETGLRRALQEARQENDMPPGGLSSSACPQLEIVTLGRFEISLQGRILASLEDFSKHQREFVALLLCAPSMRISRENVQLALWPESPPDRARSSFDSLLLRFRKKLAELIAPLSVENYLSFRRGILSLENCRIDALAVVDSYEKGKAWLKKGEPGQAEGALSFALGSWQGPFMAGVCSNEICLDFVQKLENVVSECAGKLGSLLVREGREGEAIELLYRVLQANPIDDALVRQLCRLLREGKNPERAQKLLKYYGHSLRKEGFAESEIAEILGGI